MVTGLMEGFSREAIPQLDQCLKNSDVVVKNVEKVIADFQKTSLSSMVDATKMIAKIVKEVKESLSGCNIDKAQLEKYEKAAKSLKHPKTFVYNSGHDIVLNG